MVSPLALKIIKNEIQYFSFSCYCKLWPDPFGNHKPLFPVSEIDSQDYRLVRDFFFTSSSLESLKEAVLLFSNGYRSN